MAKAINAFRTVGRRLNSLFGTRAFHREIALVSNTVEDSSRLARALLGTTQDEARALQSDDEIARALLTSSGQTPQGKTAKGEVSSFHANYLVPGKKGKLQRWMFHLPTWGKNGDEKNKTNWKHNADTFVVCWPYRHLGQDQSTFQDISFYLFGSVGDARTRGRLRRLAVAVTDVPANKGPRHPSQCRLDVPNRRSFQHGLRKLLAESEEQPGNPLADPTWREFLELAIARDRNFSRLMETMRRALDKSCPLFFVSESPETSIGLGSMLSWIAGKRKTGPTRAGKWVRKLAVTATLGLLVLLFIGLRMPKPSGELQPVETWPVDSLFHDVSARLDGYKRALGLSRVVVGETSAEPSLRASSILVENEFRARCLEEMAINVLLSAKTSNTEARVQESSRLAELAIAQEQVRRDHMETAKRQGIAFRNAHSWEDAISNTAFWAALLSYEYSDSASRFASLQNIVPEITPVLSGIGRTEVAAFLVRLSSTTSGRAFYDVVQNGWDQGGAVREVLSKAAQANVLPGPDAPIFVERVKQVSLDTLLENKEAYLSHLDGIRRFACFARDSVPTPLAIAAAESERLTKDIQDVISPREMVLLFEYSHDTNWHVDFRSGTGAGGWKAARWNDSDDSAGCRVRVSVAAGDLISIRLNEQMRNHQVTSETASCVGESEEETLRLTGEAGSLNCSGWQIKWSVIENWPQWPPMDR